MGSRVCESHSRAERVVAHDQHGPAAGGGPHRVGVRLRGRRPGAVLVRPLGQVGAERQSRSARASGGRRAAGRAGQPEQAEPVSPCPSATRGPAPCGLQPLRLDLRRLFLRDRFGELRLRRFGVDPPLLRAPPERQGDGEARERQDEDRRGQGGDERLPPRPRREVLPGGPPPGEDRPAVEEAAQVGGQVRGGGVARGRLLLQALQADGFEVARRRGSSRDGGTGSWVRTCSRVS